MAFEWRTDWKKPVLWGASFAVAGVLAIFLLLMGYEWYTSRPKEWDVDALKGVSTTASQYFTFNQNDNVNKLKGAGFNLHFIVENKTGKDITLPQDTTFFKRNEKSQALEEIKLVMKHSYQIPAHERAEFVADLESSCSEENIDTGVTTERDANQCFQDVIGSVSELVAFDNDSHIRVNLPKPVFKH